MKEQSYTIGGESMSGTGPDQVEKALCIAGKAEQRDISLRFLGGVAIRLRAVDQLHPVFQRVTPTWIGSFQAGPRPRHTSLFEDLGYSPQARFNAIHGLERLLFFDERHDRQVDVFVGTFRMSHEIPFGKRLAMGPLTTPLAELLLTKLQIAELNEKNVKDAQALLHDHPVEDEDGDSVTVGHFAKLCASDWGLWRTFTAHLAAVGDRLEQYDLAEEGERRVVRIQKLQERIEQEPKSLGWKMRSEIGDRKRWYELPEEVEGGP